MTGATFILIYKKPADAAATAEALKFFAWAYAKGGKMAEDLDYVPMPAKVVTDSREDVVDRHQGRRRQAAVLADELRTKVPRCARDDSIAVGMTTRLSSRAIARDLESAERMLECPKRH